MASVVEYKGLKAGYHCGYCDCEEGKVSCGECPHGCGWRGRLASDPRTARRALRQPLAWERTGPTPQTPTSLSQTVLPRLFPFMILYPSHPHRRWRSRLEKERK